MRNFQFIGSNRGSYSGRLKGSKVTRISPAALMQRSGHLSRRRSSFCQGSTHVGYLSQTCEIKLATAAPWHIRKRPPRVSANRQSMKKVVVPDVRYSPRQSDTCSVENKDLRIEKKDSSLKGSSSDDEILINPKYL